MWVGNVRLWRRVGGRWLGCARTSKINKWNHGPLAYRVANLIDLANVWRWRSDYFSRGKVPKFNRKLNINFYAVLGYLFLLLSLPKPQLVLDKISYVFPCLICLPKCLCILYLVCLLILQTLPSIFSPAIAKKLCQFNESELLSHVFNFGNLCELCNISVKKNLVQRIFLDCWRPTRRQRSQRCYCMAGWHA